MANLFYSTVATVKRNTGIRFDDLDFVDEAELDSQIEEWLMDAKDLIDRNRNRNFHEETEIPRGIHNIASRLAGNMVAQAKLRRETAIVHNDDYQQNFIDDRVMTAAIRKDLKLYPKKRTFGMMVSPIKTEL